MDSIRIRCPKCNWEPDGQPYWMCACGHTWDTFSTGGRCPACKMVWEQTQCIEDAGGCMEWSPHLDWYENLNQVAVEIIAQSETVEVVETNRIKLQNR